MRRGERSGEEGREVVVRRRGESSGEEGRE